MGKILFKGGRRVSAAQTIWMTERAARQIIDRMKRKGMGHAASAASCYDLDWRGAGRSAPTRVCAGAEEQAMARRLSLKKWKTFAAEPDSQKKKLRLAAIPSLRGFSDSVILEMLKELRS